MPHDHHDHDDHAHALLPPDPALRVKALETILSAKGLIDPAALDAIIEKSEPSELNNILQQVRYDVSTGESLSDAFAKYPRIFSNLYISSLQAGEKSGAFL